MKVIFSHNLKSLILELHIGDEKFTFSMKNEKVI